MCCSPCPIGNAKRYTQPLHRTNLIHSVLFKKWNWEEDKQKLIDNNALLDNRVSTSDLFDILIRVNRDATNILIDKLQSCPPGELELLKKALYD